MRSIKATTFGRHQSPAATVVLQRRTTANRRPKRAFSSVGGVGCSFKVQCLRLVGSRSMFGVEGSYCVVWLFLSREGPNLFPFAEEECQWL